jgi:CheY-like chemotaxis protein
MCDPQDERPFVLFADDDPSILDIFKYMAGQKGWRADTATTAREVIEKVNEHCTDVGQCYDCIVTDVNFMDNQAGPRLSGITAIAQIRKKYADVPVIVYSAYLNSMMRDEIKSLGNAEAVEKLARYNKGGQTDIISVVERVERIILWAKKRYTGPDRRLASSGQYEGEKRRQSDHENIRVPEVLEQVMTEARALREIHSHGAVAGINKRPMIITPPATH